MKLLFILAHWHGLAKLRLHTEATIELLHQTTGELGSCLRDFEKKTCSAYVTRELEREANLRRRRAARSKAATSAAMGKQKSSANMIDAATDSSQSISLTTSGVDKLFLTANGNELTRKYRKRPFKRAGTRSHERRFERVGVHTART